MADRFTADTAERTGRSERTIQRDAERGRKLGGAMSVVTRFDYAGVPAEKIQDVRDASARIKVRMSRTAQDIIEIGRDLIAVKEAIGHEHYLQWLDAEFGMTDRTALSFCRVAEQFGSKSEMISDLPPTVLYALAAPSTPEPVREAAVERVRQGETITSEQVRRVDGHGPRPCPGCEPRPPEPEEGPARRLNSRGTDAVRPPRCHGPGAAATVICTPRWSGVASWNIGRQVCPVI